MGTGGAAHTTGELRAAPPKFFSGNGVSMAAMCAESSPPNVAYLRLPAASAF